VAISPADPNIVAIGSNDNRLIDLSPQFTQTPTSSWEHRRLRPSSCTGPRRTASGFLSGDRSCNVAGPSGRLLKVRALSNNRLKLTARARSRACRREEDTSS